MPSATKAQNSLNYSHSSHPHLTSETVFSWKNNLINGRYTQVGIKLCLNIPDGSFNDLVVIRVG